MLRRFIMSCDVILVFCFQPCCHRSLLQHWCMVCLMEASWDRAVNICGFIDMTGIEWLRGVMEWPGQCWISMVSLLFILIHSGIDHCGSGCLLLRPLCWSVLPWSVPHVFDITVTRLPSLSGEMENVRDWSREVNSFPTSDGMRNTLAGWLGRWRHSVGAEHRVEAKQNPKCVCEISLFLSFPCFHLYSMHTSIQIPKINIQCMHTSSLSTAPTGFIRCFLLISVNAQHVRCSSYFVWNLSICGWAFLENICWSASLFY